MIKFFRTKHNKVDNDAFKQTSKNKSLKVIFVNIFFIFLFIFVAETISYIYVVDQGKPENLFYALFTGFDDFYFFQDNYGLDTFREHLKKENSKNSIVLLGCSFAYGDKLDDKDNFSGQLFNLTKYNVYNYAVTSGSQREGLYLLRTNHISSEIDTNSVKYVYLLLTKNSGYFLTIEFILHILRKLLIRTMKN